MFLIFLSLHSKRNFIQWPDKFSCRTRLPGFSNCSLTSLQRVNDACLYNVPTYKVTAINRYTYKSNRLARIRITHTVTSFFLPLWKDQLKIIFLGSVSPRKAILMTREANIPTPVRLGYIQDYWYCLYHPTTKARKTRLLGNARGATKCLQMTVTVSIPNIKHLMISCSCTCTFEPLWRFAIQYEQHRM